MHLALFLRSNWKPLAWELVLPFSVGLVLLSLRHHLLFGSDSCRCCADVPDTLLDLEDGQEQLLPNDRRATLRRGCHPVERLVLQIKLARKDPNATVYTGLVYL